MTELTADHIAIVRDLSARYRIGRRILRRGLGDWIAKVEAAQQKNEELILADSFEDVLRKWIGENDARWLSPEMAFVTDTIRSLLDGNSQKVGELVHGVGTIYYVPFVMALADALNERLMNARIHHRFGKSSNSLIYLTMPKLSKATSSIMRFPSSIRDSLKGRLETCLCIVDNQVEPDEINGIKIYCKPKGGHRGGNRSTYLTLKSQSEYSFRVSGTCLLPNGNQHHLDQEVKCAGDDFARLLRGMIVDYFSFVEKMKVDQKIARRRFLKIF